MSNRGNWSRTYIKLKLDTYILELDNSTFALHYSIESREYCLELGMPMKGEHGRIFYNPANDSIMVEKIGAYITQNRNEIESAHGLDDRHQKILTRMLDKIEFNDFEYSNFGKVRNWLEIFKLPSGD